MSFEEWVAANPNLDIPQWIRDFCASEDEEERHMIIAHKPAAECLLLNVLWTMYLKEGGIPESFSTNTGNQREARRLYCKEGLTMKEIAIRLNTSYATIQRTMDKAGIKRRPRWASGKHLERMGFPRTEMVKDENWWRHK